MSEWGPWIEHDGQNPRLEPGVIVFVMAQDGRTTTSQPEKVAWTEVDPGVGFRKARYRVLKPSLPSTKTLLDEYAMAALTGLLANPKHAAHMHKYVNTAEIAFKHAEACVLEKACREEIE